MRYAQASAHWLCLDGHTHADVAVWVAINLLYMVAWSLVLASASSRASTLARHCASIWTRVGATATRALVVVGVVLVLGVEVVWRLRLLSARLSWFSFLFGCLGSELFCSHTFDGVEVGGLGKS